MNLSIFAQISLVITLAAVVAGIMRLLKQPLIIGYILTGIIVGPILHLVHGGTTMQLFSDFGIALLLFIIGLGLNPKVIKEVGKVTAVVGLAQMVLSTAAGYFVGRLVGFGTTESLFLGLALAFSSTIIILKLLSDKKEQTRLYGKVVTGLLLLQDLLAMVALLFVTSETSSGSVNGHEILMLFGKGILIAVPIFIVGNVVLPKFHRYIAGSPEFLFLFALGWGFGCAALFEINGFSLEIGALIAGVSLASLPYTQEMAARLRPLRDFFIVVFFIVLGTGLNFAGIQSLLWPIALASAVVIIVKPVVVTWLMGAMGYTKRTSFKSGVAMAQVSEFSLILVLLAQQQNLIDGRVVSLVTLVALISIAASAYLIIYADPLFNFLEKHIYIFERKRAAFEHESRNRYQLVLFGYHKGGHEFLHTFKSLKKRFVVVDYDPDVIDILEHQKVEYVYGDASDVELLEEVGLDKVKLVVSTITDYQTTLGLMNLMASVNPSAVVICHADTIEEASELYQNGASYVMMPHYIGSEKIGAFIKRNGLNKTEFKHFREKHMEYLETHNKDFLTEADEVEGAEEA